MASGSSKPEDTEVTLTCPICQDLFEEPVILQCSHTFCAACIKNCWKGVPVKLCPICRKKFAKPVPVCNRTVKDLVEAEKIRRAQPAAPLVLLCPRHSEPLKLFCLEEKEPICCVCQASRKHNRHTWQPIDETAPEHREKLRNTLMSMEEVLASFNGFKQTYDETAYHIKIQAEDTESSIREEFNKLREFLQDEEEARVAALRMEAKQKTDQIKKKLVQMKREIASVLDAIRAIQQELSLDDVSLLQNFKANEEKRAKAAKVTLPTSQFDSGALIDVAKHLGNLNFKVWEKMTSVVKFTNVILDPNTASPFLVLSDDLTSVGQHGPWQPIPDNPERNSKSTTVLGSEGFSSGQYSWEVEVGDHPEWFIGVAKESVDWKGEIDPCPENGIWCVLLEDGEYCNGSGDILSLASRPERIRVQLDCDSGQVSFYGSGGMLIDTQQIVAEKLYPYFGIGVALASKHRRVTILQSELSVMSF